MKKNLRNEAQGIIQRLRAAHTSEDIALKRELRATIIRLYEILRDELSHDPYSINKPSDYSPTLQGLVMIANESIAKIAESSMRQRNQEIVLRAFEALLPVADGVEALPDKINPTVAHNRLRAIENKN